MAVRVRLDRQIRIESEDITTNGSNERVVNGWLTLITIWAGREDNQGKEEYEGRQLVADGMTNWTISYPPAIYMPTTKMRVVEVATGAIYDIHSITEPNGSVKEYLVLGCKQVQQR